MFAFLWGVYSSRARHKTKTTRRLTSDHVSMEEYSHEDLYGLMGRNVRNHNIVTHLDTYEKRMVCLKSLLWRLQTKEEDRLGV